MAKSKFKHMFMNDFSSTDLSFDAGSDSVDGPVTSVVVEEMYFCEANTRVSLTCTIEEAVMNRNSYASVRHVTWVRADQHRLVVVHEMASTHLIKLIN